MSKFTPGPWRVSGGRHALGDPAKPRMWWLREGAVSLGTDNEADAHLCAAAPDLYEALREASDHLAEIYAKYQTRIGPFASQSQRINGKARSALAKARGES